MMPSASSSALSNSQQPPTHGLPRPISNDDSSTPQGEKRKRVSRACDQCNILRTRCGGGCPCERCLETGTLCEYTRVPKKRGVAKGTTTRTPQPQSSGMTQPGGSGPSTGSPSYHDSGPQLHRQTAQLRPDVGRQHSAYSNVSYKTESPQQVQRDLQGSRTSSITSHQPVSGNASVSSPDTRGHYGQYQHQHQHQQQAQGYKTGVHTPYGGSGTFPTLTSAAPSGMTPLQTEYTPPVSDMRTQMPQQPYSNDSMNDTFSSGVYLPIAQPQIAQQPLLPAASMQQASTGPVDGPYGGGGMGHVQSGSVCGYGGYGYEQQAVQQLQPGLGPGPGAAAASHSFSPGGSFGGLFSGPGTIANTPAAVPAPLPLPLGIPTSQAPTHTSFPGVGVLAGMGTGPFPRLPHPGNRTHVPPTCKYPILHPLLPALAPIIGADVAASLLETYFDNSPLVLGYCIRRSSILDKTNPRKTTKALVYAMLCVASHHAEHTALSSSPVTRNRVVHRLFELCLEELKPLRHESGGVLDDVITYIQLGTIISASEFKGISLRWWNAAWTLARELNLNRESGFSEGDEEANQEGEALENFTEEEREERRRTWWILFAVDRHLALCYHRPLMLGEWECEKLRWPIDDVVWEADVDLVENGGPKGSGVFFEVRGRGVFEFFLPLMCILGEIVHFHNAMQHPTLAPSVQAQQDMKAVISAHLEGYSISLENFVPADGMDEGPFRAYAEQIMHTLHILLSGKWDALEMLDDIDGWITSPEFLDATAHAVQAAEAVGRILVADPSISYLPFFSGIYLLQGSFLLLLILDQLPDPDQSVISACEGLVRAHESAICTLDTAYQRNFRRIMSGTISIVKKKRGGVVDERAEEANRAKVREVLGLYRWTKEGRGLVVSNQV